MSQRIRSSIPEVEWEDTVTLGKEMTRRDVFKSGEYAGQVIYVRRRRKSGGSDYGWRDARSAPQSKLKTMDDAIGDVLRRRKENS